VLILAAKAATLAGGGAQPVGCAPPCGSRALYDIHGNLPALEAVLAEVDGDAPDAIVVGGDVAPGWLVEECLERLRRSARAAGELVVAGKGRRVERLLLPEDVGEAIVCYLQDGRPATALDRSLIVRVRAPHQGLTGGGITQIVFAAARRAGLGPIHAHRLRHTAATAMLGKATRQASCP
jgi:integrase